MAVRIAEKPRPIPDSMLEAIAYLHGAMDPDSGHLVCHHYPLGLTLVEAGGAKAPALSVGECIYLVPQPWGSAIYQGSREASIRALGEDYTLVGEARVDTGSVSLILSLLREEKAEVEVRYSKAVIHGRGEVGVAVFLIKASWGEWVAVVAPCKGQERKEGDLYV